ncbi:MAG: thiazole synthase [Phycisphaerales bacterium]|nr:thiazole synthase [Phycisphaerales bacterium]
MSPLKIADKLFNSRLFIGTGKFSSIDMMESAIEASGTELVTVALKRVDMQDGINNQLLRFLSKQKQVSFLPNTSGVRNAKEAVFAAEVAREVFQTNWLKLEIHPEPKYLFPDPIETLQASIELVKLGFIVLPYCHADPILCKRLEDAGVAAVMPLGAPIGSNLGLTTRTLLDIIIEQATVPVIVDAGIGAPSDATKALEIGASAVLVNTAIAIAQDPILMARAFKNAVIAGYEGFTAKIAPSVSQARASSTMTQFLE